MKKVAEQRNEEKQALLRERNESRSEISRLLKIQADLAEILDYAHYKLSENVVQHVFNAKTEVASNVALLKNKFCKQLDTIESESSSKSSPTVQRSERTKVPVQIMNLNDGSSANRVRSPLPYNAPDSEGTTVSKAIVTESSSLTEIGRAHV